MATREEVAAAWVTDMEIVGSGSRYWGGFPVRDHVWFESQEPRKPVRNV